MREGAFPSQERHQASVGRSRSAQSWARRGRGCAGPDPVQTGAPLAGPLQSFLIWRRALCLTHLTAARERGLTTCNGMSQVPALTDLTFEKSAHWPQFLYLCNGGSKENGST